jgi:hypothetical protein
VTWVVCFLATFRGVKSITAATRFTVVLPWILLAIFIIVNATLEGSKDGVRAYIGEWDMSVLRRGDAWSDAAAQVIFSVGATVGVNLSSAPADDIGAQLAAMFVLDQTVQSNRQVLSPCCSEFRRACEYMHGMRSRLIFSWCFECTCSLGHQVRALFTRSLRASVQC